MSLHWMDVPTANIVVSPDGTHMAGWLVVREHAAREEERTQYAIGVWPLVDLEPAPDARPSAELFFEHVVDNVSGYERGGRIVGIEFSADGAGVVVRYQSSAAFAEPEEVVLDIPPASG